MPHGVGLLAIVAALVTLLNPASSLSNDEPDLPRDASERAASWTAPQWPPPRAPIGPLLEASPRAAAFTGTTPSAPSSDAARLAVPALAQAWRETGLAYVDLPMRFRARFDSTYSSNRYLSEDLARPFTAQTGPSRDREHSLEHRLAVTRPVIEGIELELAWGGRSELGGVNLLDFNRHTVGAVIRIVP